MWVAENEDKEVVELLPQGYTRPWPDYLDFILTHDELVRICSNPEANREWVHKLTAVAGVYLITHAGNQYVGSAYGREGIYGRFAGRGFGVCRQAHPEAPERGRGDSGDVGVVGSGGGGGERPLCGRVMIPQKIKTNYLLQ